MILPELKFWKAPRRLLRHGLSESLNRDANRLHRYHQRQVSKDKSFYSLGYGACRVDATTTVSLISEL